MKIKEKPMYNKELKERFITLKYAKSTQKMVSYLFQKTNSMEVQLNKDVYQFNNDEVAMLMNQLELGSTNSARSQSSYLKKYVAFCIQHGYLETKINLFDKYNSQNMDRYVNQIAKRKRFIKDEEELNKILNICKNPQDKVIIALLFEGVSGVHFEELVNLKKTDVEGNLLILTRDDGTERILEVKYRTIEIIKDAIVKDLYYPNNGKGTSSRREYMPIHDTEYVLRPAMHGDNNGKLNHIVINSRVKRIAEEYKNPHLNPRNIWMSGMIQLAKELKAELGRDLEKEEYEKINERFGKDIKYQYQTRKDIEGYI